MGIQELKDKIALANETFTGSTRKLAINGLKRRLEQEKQLLARLEQETKTLIEKDPDLLQNKEFVITRILVGDKSLMLQDAFNLLFTNNLEEADTLVDTIIKKEKQKLLWASVRSLVEYEKK